MHQRGPTLHLTATDLAKAIACNHLIHLERAAAEGNLPRPHRTDPALDLLMERGRIHERDYVERLKAEGRDVTDLTDHEGRTAVERTESAMQAGAGVIVQAALKDGRWEGRADLLLRIEGKSDLGNFSYEVADTKLAQETRGGTVLQLCLYTDLVGKRQGLTPDRMHVVKPGNPPVEESFRFEDYAAYYRLVRKRLEEAVDDKKTESYPGPVPHCEICSWWTRCDARRRDDDHLSFVAGLQTLHRTELERQGIATLESFAGRETPLPERPDRGSRETYDRLHGQARIQARGRSEGRPVYELLPLEPDRGLARLPPPSRLDVFFDLESDPFVGDGGLEYLFGWAFREGEGEGDLVYRSEKATSRAEERRALERFVDFVMERWRDDPGMHVYHFSPYEPAAIKRLMGRHATRESEVDRLLRAGRFVDLHAVARQGMRASVERYSLKDLEHFTGFVREVDLKNAGDALRRVASALELSLPVPEEDLAAVEGYNRDDCFSTATLQEWLERLREEHATDGVEVPRPEEREGDPSEKVEEREAEVREVYDRLVAGLPEEPDDCNVEQKARWLLAHALDYFRREDKCAWWEYFRLHDLDDEELLAERKTVFGLEFIETVGGTAKCPIHRYRFPPQEAALGEGDPVHEIGGDGVGKVEAVDQARRTIDIKKKATAAALHPKSILSNKKFPIDPMDGSLLAVARSVAENGVDGSGPYRAARDLLLKRPPRLGTADPGPLVQEGESAVDAAVRLVAELDCGTLAIQGPPGTGKTHAGGRMIVELAKQGKRIGVIAVGHKVIRNLLDSVFARAEEQGVTVEAVHKNNRPSDNCPDNLREVRNNDEALGALDEGKIVGGTSWLWARDDAEGKLDYLFVDEAGQLSLAQLLAAARSARNLVLLGDPRQLEQPQQGTHPEGSGVSALEHLLDGHETIPAQTGLFLDRTWRLHPSICRFASEVYYERRLESREGLERQALEGATPFEGSGLFFAPVPHEGNQNTSAEEVEAVSRIVSQLLGPDSTWVDASGERRPLQERDILIVAPYNAHVGALVRRLPRLRVGTVDKFQGQEAPVVIYSMASSSVEDAPRGMEFLFEPNRLNVATSRARAVCVLVASPGLVGVDCRTPVQMRWANGVCRFLELGRIAI